MIFIAETEIESGCAAALDYRGCRHLVAQLLYQAVQDARKGDAVAAGWLGTVDAARWALLLDLRAWPPTAEQVSAASPQELRERAREAEDS